VTNDELEQQIIRALRQGTYRADARPEDATGKAKRQRIAGRWEGYARQKLNKGTLLKPLPKISESMVPHDTSILITVRLTMDITGDHLLSGNGELEFHYRPLGVDFDQTVYVDIDGSLLEGNRFAVELQNIEDNSHLAHFSGTISDDGLTLTGKYQAFGIATKKAVSGDVFLEKIPDVPESCEIISAQRKPEVLLDIIRQARRSILATHFTTEIPPGSYISLMLEKLRNEVKVSLIAAFHPDAPKEVHGWRRSFRDVSLRPFYQEYLFPGTPLPSDIVVVDDEIALQCFAAYADASDGSFVICHHDRRIARRFREYLEALMRSPGKGASIHAKPIPRQAL
jgi:hypothetical protein